MARSMAGNKPRTRCDSMDDLPEKLGFRKRSVSCAIYPRFYTTDNNPLDKIVISKLLSKETSKSSFKVDPFDRGEVKAILEATHHEQIKNLFQFAFFTGLRTSELIALEWEDVDLGHGLLYVVRAVVKKQIRQALNVKLHPGTIADVEVVGSCVVFNSGFGVIHTGATDEDVKEVEGLLGVKCTLTTANFGSPYLRSAILANSNGFIVGDASTGVEMANIDEGLGFL